MILTIATFTEVLFINLLHTNTLAKKKYSGVITFMSLLIFTSLLLYGLYSFDLISDETTARSVLIGFFFILPIYYLYDSSFKKIITIMIYCWTYTFIINTISFGLATVISNDSINLYTFIFQTVLILVSIIFVSKFSKNYFHIVLDKSNTKTQYMLLTLGASIFLAFVGIRYYIDPNNAVYLFLTLVVLTLTIISYTLIYTIVQSNLNLNTSMTIAYKDALTGINNRYSLFISFEEMIKEKNNFSLLFLDLDDLKSVNDKHSHLVGDGYIKEFARILEKLIHNNGVVYRFAGDEFVCLLQNSLNDLEIEELKQQIIDEMNESYEFNGVSMGLAYYPKNGKSVDELINFADKAMYGDKRRKKVRR